MKTCVKHQVLYVLTHPTVRLYYIESLDHTCDIVFFFLLYLYHDVVILTLYWGKTNSYSGN